MGPSPAPSACSARTWPRNWDRLVSEAEENKDTSSWCCSAMGSSTTSDELGAEPVDAANRGGFLDRRMISSPTRLMTLVKYLPSVARWGWSPAIVAQELFNEVHWTDVRHGREQGMSPTGTTRWRNTSIPSTTSTATW